MCMTRSPKQLADGKKCWEGRRDKALFDYISKELGHSYRHLKYLLLEILKGKRKWDERRTTWTKPPAAAPIPTVTATAAPPATFPVICPHGAGPGSHLRVRAPNTGQEMTVIVPAGDGAGSAS